MRSGTHHKTEARPPWIFVLACTTLVICGSVLLVLYHHHQQNRIILTSSEALFATIANRVQQNLNNAQRGPSQALHLLAHDPLWRANTLDRRLDYLEKLVQVLIDLPHLNSVYVSWADGDFLLLRPLLRAEMRERFEAPDGAAWMLWHIAALGGKREAEYRFYDDSLRLVEARPVANSGFDPRTRLWHELATGSQTQRVTPPYVFHSTSEFGITIAQPAARGVVLGADITLDRLSTSLTGHGLTPSSELLLYDGQGTVVAYHDALRVRNTAHGSALRLRTFHELGSTLLARLAEDGYQVERQASLTLEGQGWLVLQQRVNMPGLADTYLAVLIPERELLEPTGALRQRSLLVGILGSLAILLLFWLLAWMQFRRRL